MGFLAVNPGMSPGETTLLKILAHSPEVEAAQRLFHEGFPTSLSEMAFRASLKSLITRGLVRQEREGGRVSLTAQGRETLAAELRAEELNMG